MCDQIGLLFLAGGFVSRRDLVFISLAGIFVSNALLGEILGGKLIQLGPFALSIGVIPWPVVFITTDLINEHFGKEGVRKLTFLTVGLILYAFLITYFAMQVPAATFSPIQDLEFSKVFSQSLWIIAGSVTAFLISQLVDVTVFWFFRHRTGHRLLWLRATGSTVISQLVDTFVVLGIAFYLPGKLNLEEFMNVSLTNYTYKLLVAIGATPLIYLGHNLVDRFLKTSENHQQQPSTVMISSG